MNRPPFSPPGAIAARQRVGLSPQQVAQQMGLCGVRVSSELVSGWECGTHHPDEQQLFVLADVLWCSTTDLMGIEPRTLVELRLARRMSITQLAQQIRMDPAIYAQVEAHHRWYGTLRQTIGLADALRLSLRQLVGAVGAVDELAGHLYSCVKGRWKPHILPVAQIANLSQIRVRDALQTLHTEYARVSRKDTVGPATQTSDLRPIGSSAENSTFRQRLVDRFWELIGEAAEARPFLATHFSVYSSGYEAYVRALGSASGMSWAPIAGGRFEACGKNEAESQVVTGSCRPMRIFQRKVIRLDRTIFIFAASASFIGSIRNAVPAARSRRRKRD